jgi:hypothetical protein
MNSIKENNIVEDKKKEKQITNADILNIARLSISSVRTLVWIFFIVIGLIITMLSWYGYSSIEDI